jgi:hypothetical protein
VKERRQWSFTKNLVPGAKTLAVLVGLSSTFTAAGMTYQARFGPLESLPDSVGVQNQQISALGMRVVTVEDSVGAVAAEVRAVESAVGGNTVSIVAAVERIDAIETSIVQVFNELQRIRCLSRLSASSERLLPWQVDDRCP